MMRSWENNRLWRIYIISFNLRRGTNFEQMFQEWVWDAELKYFLLTISNLISYLALWSRKSVLQLESFCHIPDLKWIKLLTFILYCSFSMSWKCLFFSAVVIVRSSSWQCKNICPLSMWRKIIMSFTYFIIRAHSSLRFVKK